MQINCKIVGKSIAIVLYALTLTGCYTLHRPVVTTSGSEQVTDYQYAFIIPTGSVTGSSGSVGMSYRIYGTNLSYGVYGNNTQTANPSEIIAGYLMKQGYTILPEISPDLAERTLVVSYGQTSKEQQFIGYAQNIIIQFRNAKTHNLVTSCEADGYSENDATTILQAITRALDAVFKPSDAPADNNTLYYLY